MTFPRKIIFIAVFLALGAAVFRSHADQKCWRPADTVIWYPPDPHQVTLKDGSKLYRSGSAEIRRIGLADGRLVLQILGDNSTGDSKRPGSRVWATTDAGRNWRGTMESVASTLGVHGTPLVQAPSNPRIIYQDTANLLLFLRSDDGGETWQLPQFSIEGTPREDLAFRVARQKGYRVWFKIAAIHPRQAMTVFATIAVVPWEGPLDGIPKPVYRVEGVYVSEDGGETWSKFTDALTADEPIGISASKPHIMFGHGPQGIVRSTDGGVHWDPVGQQAALEAGVRFLAEKQKEARSSRRIGLEVRQFVIDPNDDGRVFIVSNKGLYRSLDGGQTWCLADLGFDVLNSINSVGINPDRAKEFFVGTKYGILHTVDDGCNFEKILLP